MKRTFTTLLMMCVCMVSFSQYYYIPHTTTPGNPGTLNTTSEYPVGGGLDAGWTSIHSGSASTPDWTTVQTLPFAFDFNGSPVTQYKVSTSGVLTFDVAATTPPPYSHTAIPSASIPDNSIVVWGLNGSGSNDHITKRTFGTAPNRQHWIFFTSYTIPSLPNNCWTYWSIVLEETTNKIYLVDQRTANCAPKMTLGIQIDATTTEQVVGSPNVPALASNDFTSADNYYYEFIPGNRPQYDLAGVNVDMSTHLILGNAPFTVKADLTNLGAATITSFDLNYSINGGPTVTTNVTGVNIGTFNTYNATSSTSWTPAAVGSYNVEVWASNINGNPDNNTANDKVSKSIFVVSQVTVKKPFIEDFGSATCPPCVPFAAKYDPLLFTNGVNYSWGKVNAIKYQMNWPSPGNDPYYNPDALARRTYYGVNSIPSAFIDGDELAASSTSPVTSDQAEIDAYVANPGFLNLEVFYTLSGNNLTVNGTVSPLGDFPTSNFNLKLRIAVIEDSIYYTGGTTAQVYYYQVMRKMLPNADGITIGPLTNAVDKTFSETYPLTVGTPLQNNHYISTSMNNISAVAFIQDDNNKEILQSAVAAFPVGIQSADVNDMRLALYPNPAKDQINITVELAEAKDILVNIFDVLGKRMVTIDHGVLGAGNHNLKLSTENLSNGIYFVEINSGNEKISKKIVVNK